MCPEKNHPSYHQSTLALEAKENPVWEQLPQAQRLRCRQLLAQWLSQVVRPANPPRSHEHERQD